MKIIFIGTVEFSKKCLQKILDLNADVVGVITKRESNFNADFVDLTDVCEAHNLPVMYVDKVNSAETVEWIKSKNANIIFCFGWSHILGKDILNAVPMGVVGYHPAALPQNRGRHPLIWALALGLKETASTFFFMDEGADSGDILSQEKLGISYEDDAQSFQEKLFEVALNQITEFLPELQNGTYKRIKQDDSLASYWRKRGAKDGLIDFRMSSLAIYNLVRALTKPYVGAHLVYNGEEIKIWRINEEKCNLANIEPGKIIDIKGNAILVKCYDNAVWIVDHEFTELPEVGEYL